MSDIRPQFRASTFPPVGETLIAMVSHKDRLIISTDQGVYELNDGVWSRMAFVEAVLSEDSSA
jgi:hypothetical protein